MLFRSLGHRSSPDSTIDSGRTGEGPTASPIGSDIAVGQPAQAEVVAVVPDGDEVAPSTTTMSTAISSGTDSFESTAPLVTAGDLSAAGSAATQPMSRPVTQPASPSGSGASSPPVTTSSIPQPATAEPPSPPTRSAGPVTPPSNPGKPVTPPSNPGKPVTPPSNSGKPVTPPPNRTKPTRPDTPATPGGPSESWAGANTVTTPKNRQSVPADTRPTNGGGQGRKPSANAVDNGRGASAGRAVGRRR